MSRSFIRPVLAAATTVIAGVSQLFNDTEAVRNVTRTPDPVQLPRLWRDDPKFQPYVQSPGTRQRKRRRAERRGVRR